MTDHPPHFNPDELQKIVDRLKAEGRLPSMEAFLTEWTKVVDKYRSRVENHGLFLVPPRPPDVTVENHGSIYLVRPRTTQAQAWIDDNVQGYYAYWIGDTLIVEHRYIEALVAGMREEGLNVEF